jgi:exopolyphosphatase/guanosine-5'-triphosphate,3'-diphosphate pyrophosphatase
VVDLSSPLAGRSRGKARGTAGNRPRGDTGSAPREGANAARAERPHGRGLSTHFAAIDLGTNNCRLLIARAAEEGFVVVDAFSRIVRLGEGLHLSGAISEAAMDRAVAALSICADKLRRRRVSLSRAVATEACRQASNGQQLIDRIYRETGIVLDIISPAEEARLAVMGCHALLAPGNGPALIFDIGGGSTELVRIDDTADGVAIVDWVSVPWGVVSLTESAPLNGDDRESLATTYAAMRATMANAFAAFAARNPAGSAGTPRLLGTSGTITTLASVHLDLPRYERSAIDGIHVGADAMRAVSQRLATQSPGERARHPCIGRERADLVVAGCAILEAIIDIWPATDIGVADRGIREGILRGLMQSGRRHGA